METYFNAKDWLEYEYPTTIIADRYNGTYSGGKYTCWAMDADMIPPEVEGGDAECYHFWHTTDLIVGKGATPDKAMLDLRQKYKKYIELTG